MALPAAYRPGMGEPLTCRTRPSRSVRGPPLVPIAPIDTGTAAGKAFLDMPGVFAEFETNLRKERQAEGIAAAKARGVYKGRKAKIDAAVVRKLRYEEKLGPAEIA